MIVNYLDDEEIQNLAKREPQAAGLIQELARTLLLHMMRLLGSKYLGDPQVASLDLLLWTAVEKGAQRLTDEEVTLLEQYSTMANGWWALDAQDAQFMSKDEWREHYHRVKKENNI